MNLQKIEALAGLLSTSTLVAIEFEDGDSMIRMVRAVPDSPQSSKPVVAAVAADIFQPAAATFLSQGIGVFRLGHPQRETPCVVVGRSVEPGDALGYLHCGELITELTADRPGTVRKICVEDGQLVGYGQVLIEWN